MVDDEGTLGVGVEATLEPPRVGLSEQAPVYSHRATATGQLHLFSYHVLLSWLLLLFQLRDHLWRFLGCA